MNLASDKRPGLVCGVFRYAGRFAGISCVTAWLTINAGAAAAGVIYHVATNGNDAANGLTWTTALQTVSEGVARAVNAGDMVLLSNGVHDIAAELPIRLYGEIPAAR